MFVGPLREYVLKVLNAAEAASAAHMADPCPMSRSVVQEAGEVYVYLRLLPVLISVVEDLLGPRTMVGYLCQEVLSVCKDDGCPGRCVWSGVPLLGKLVLLAPEVLASSSGKGETKEDVHVPPCSGTAEAALVWSVGVLYVQCLGGVATEEYNHLWALWISLKDGLELNKSCEHELVFYVGQMMRRQLLLGNWAHRTPSSVDIWFASRVLATRPADRPSLAVVCSWLRVMLTGTMARMQALAAVPASETLLSVLGSVGEAVDAAALCLQQNKYVWAASTPGDVKVFVRPSRDSSMRARSVWVCLPPRWLVGVTPEVLAAQIMVCMGAVCPYGPHMPLRDAGASADNKLAKLALDAVLDSMQRNGETLQVVVCPRGVRVEVLFVEEVYEAYTKLVQRSDGGAVECVDISLDVQPPGSDLVLSAVAKRVHRARFVPHVLGKCLETWRQRAAAKRMGRSYCLAKAEVLELFEKHGLCTLELTTWLATAAISDTLDPFSLDTWVQWAILDELNTLCEDDKMRSSVSAIGSAEAVFYMCNLVLPTETLRLAAEGLLFALLAASPSLMDMNVRLFRWLALLLSLTQVEAGLGDQALVTACLAANVGKDPVPNPDEDPAVLAALMDALWMVGHSRAGCASSNAPLPGGPAGGSGGGPPPRNVPELVQAAAVRGMLHTRHGADPWWSARIALQSLLQLPNVGEAQELVRLCPPALRHRAYEVLAACNRAMLPANALDQARCRAGPGVTGLGPGRPMPNGLVRVAGAKKGRNGTKGFQLVNLSVVLEAVVKASAEAVNQAITWYGSNSRRSVLASIAFGVAYMEAFSGGLSGYTSPRKVYDVLDEAVRRAQHVQRVAVAVSYVASLTPFVGGACANSSCDHVDLGLSKAALIGLVNQANDAEGASSQAMVALSTPAGFFSSRRCVDVLVAIDNLALACLHLSTIRLVHVGPRVDFARLALDMYQRSLNLKREVVGLGSREFAIAYYNVARAYMVLGVPYYAADYFRSALSEFHLPSANVHFGAELCLNSGIALLHSHTHTLADVLQAFLGCVTMVISGVRRVVCVMLGGTAVKGGRIATYVNSALMRLMLRITREMDEVLAPRQWTDRLVDIRLQWLRFELLWATGQLDTHLELEALSVGDSRDRLDHVRLTLSNLLVRFWTPCVTKRGSLNLGYSLCFLVHVVFRLVVPDADTFPSMFRVMLASACACCAGLLVFLLLAAGDLAPPRPFPRCCCACVCSELLFGHGAGGRQHAAKGQASAKHHRGPSGNGVGLVRLLSCEGQGALGCPDATHSPCCVPGCEA